MDPLPACHGGKTALLHANAGSSRKKQAMRLPSPENELTRLLIGRSDGLPLNVMATAVKVRVVMHLGCKWTATVLGRRQRTGAGGAPCRQRGLRGGPSDVPLSAVCQPRFLNDSRRPSTTANDNGQPTTGVMRPVGPRCIFFFFYAHDTPECPAPRHLLFRGGHFTKPSSVFVSVRKLCR